ncbi:MAG TPA: hypothetical protein PLW88_05505 [Syntrophorhabdaceae bacterium]|nr:hypothetical protein [Syntrophorhabdaceae bacterium]
MWVKRKPATGEFVEEKIEVKKKKEIPIMGFEVSRIFSLNIATHKSARFSCGSEVILK